jgi:hypothetical protein
VALGAAELCTLDWSALAADVRPFSHGCLDASRSMNHVDRVGLKKISKIVGLGFWVVLHVVCARGNGNLHRLSLLPIRLRLREPGARTRAAAGVRSAWDTERLGLGAVADGGWWGSRGGCRASSYFASARSEVAHSSSAETAPSTDVERQFDH